MKRPESVLVVVHTTTGAVLLLRRCQPPDFWQSVTGSLNWDETHPQNTAARELQEETGLVVNQDVILIDCQMTNRFPILPAWRARYAPHVTENTEYVFRAELLNASAMTAIRLNPQEHLEYLWLPQRQAAQKVSSYTNRAAILALPALSESNPAQ